MDEFRFCVDTAVWYVFKKACAMCGLACCHWHSSSKSRRITLATFWCDRSAILKARLKSMKLCSLLLPAYGSHTCAPLSIDQHIQGPGLALVDFGSWHKLLSSGCAADDKLQKNAHGLCSKRRFKCA